MNLFNEAKKATPVASKKEHVEHTIENQEFHQNILRLVDVNEQLTTLDAEAKMLTAEIKGVAVKEFIRVYNDTKKFPGTFILRGTGLKAKSAGSLMFVPQDRYIKIDEERATELKKDYGAKIVTEETVYTMDSALVEKYGKVISDLILKSKDISSEDKLKLIKAETSYSVSKGTIQEAMSFNKKLVQVIEDVKPVFMMRNVKAE